MKQLKLSIFALVCASASLLAQDNYTIKSTLKIEGMPPEMAAMADMDMVTHVKGEKVKTESTGMMGSRVMVYDGTKSIMLSDMMGNKMGYTQTKAEMDANDKDTPPAKPVFEYTNEKKMIAGHECTKVLMKITVDKQPTTNVLWVTDKLPIKPNKYSSDRSRGSYDFSELKGYPLSMEFSMSRNGQTMTMVITATEINTTPVDDSVFVLDTSDYKMMTYKEMMEKVKAMGGR